MAFVNRSDADLRVGPTSRISGNGPRYRDAAGSDAEAIATLHADSWKRHYRGVFLDSFLDGNILSERMAVWHERLSRAPGTDITVVADVEGSVVGFLHMILDDDSRWGSLLDNLHVVWHLKRNGVGRTLLEEGAKRLLQQGRRNFYLWVLDQNIAAQKFYVAQGGKRVETCLRGPFPGGGHALGHRMAWADAALVAARKNGRQ